MYFDIIMVNNFIKRVISSVLLGGTLVFLLIKYEQFYKTFFCILLILMILEWFKINNNKKSLLFLFGLLYISFPIICIITSSVFNKYIVLFLFSIVWSCDIFAYLGGKLIGGAKFSPKISPNKTWSGVICGSICSFIVAWIYLEFTYCYIPSIFIILFIIASILGDLLESKVKRIIGIKDSGNIIPGHGGVLDRFDSFLLTTYTYVLYIIINRLHGMVKMDGFSYTLTHIFSDPSYVQYLFKGILS